MSHITYHATLTRLDDLRRAADARRLADEASHAHKRPARVHLRARRLRVGTRTRVHQAPQDVR
jgi:hypothetical protein